jgi:TatD DNase family protein
MTMLFDSHCHLSDERLVGEVDAVVARAREQGVTRLLTVGADPDDFDTVTALARRFAGVWAAVGVHPHIADRTDPGVLARIALLAATPEVVAVGETGLDYHYDHAPRDAQRRSFLAHLDLAERLDLPVIVHSRSADSDTAAVLRDAAAGRVRGVLHCFDGGPALLDAALEAGWYVSFSGVVTFKNYAGADLLRAVPADRLLVETDSPYLAPVPMRGKRNEPAFVRHVAEAVAAHRGVPFEGVARTTTENACTLYGIER